ncbi:hypothetical protein OE88DRAFT_1401528 [Heliocybe sulcata]|uniref:Rad50/SbcC-type AAA domain-containing protein n=1 Tax=Heliocybe sulcata TaxID=5364 RepID=A0A5C3N557_9AGAM|nr:hypothetical protein OE88DRAFT_1401528 [Heliocybe sulcata]
MASLNKLAIRGIRSFDDKQISVIEFFTPVTVIVGPNGSGKTTVIECLNQGAGEAAVQCGERIAYACCAKSLGDHEKEQYHDHEDAGKHSCFGRQQCGEGRQARSDLYEMRRDRRRNTSFTWCIKGCPRECHILSPGRFILATCGTVCPQEEVR